MGSHTCCPRAVPPSLQLLTTTLAWGFRELGKTPLTSFGVLAPLTSPDWRCIWRLLWADSQPGNHGSLAHAAFASQNIPQFHAHTAREYQTLAHSAGGRGSVTPTYHTSFPPLCSDVAVARVPPF